MASLIKLMICALPKINCFYCFGCRVLTEVSWALISRDQVLRLAEINRRIIGATS